MEKIVQESNFSILGFGFWFFPPKIIFGPPFETVQPSFNLFSVHGVVLMYLINDRSFSKKNLTEKCFYGGSTCSPLPPTCTNVSEQ